MKPEELIRQLIQAKLSSGELPRDDCSKVMGVRRMEKSATRVVTALRRLSS